MMPLIVKDFSWHQTTDLVSLVVNMKAIKAAKTDILTSNNYIRIHYHPYIFEAFLLSEVDDVQGSCTIDEGSSAVLIQLPKVNVGQEWATLENKGLDRMQKKAIRESAVSTSHKRHEEQAKVKAATRHEQKQMTVREQIRLDQEDRQRIEAIKRAEGAKAVSDMQEWTLKTKLLPAKTTSYADIPTTSSFQGDSSLDRCRFEDRLSKGDGRRRRSGNGELSLEELVKRGPSSVTILSSDEDEGDSSKTEEGFSASNHPRGAKSSFATRPFNKDASKYLEKKVIWTKTDLAKQRIEAEKDVKDTTAPGIRQEAHISVNFTPRDFTTPSRESTAPEEEEWLKKQAEARRKSGFNDADLRPEERDPSWLLDKGMALMKSECHLGAMSAFSLGIKLAPKMPELYVQRASAQFALRNFIRTVEDATQALELLTPKVSANAGDRLKTHVNRGSAFKELKMIGEAIIDLKEATRLNPDDTALATQLNELQTELDRNELDISSDED